MGNLQDFSHALTHWSFGITILVGLLASEFSGAEAIGSIFIAAISSTLSALCGSSSTVSEEQFRKKKLSDVLYFLILWLDILTNLVAAATCARLASATVDYISKGHFREFLFGMEQHSLGEPWPDVLGVTIVVVVTLLFMLGLEKSSTISALLLAALLCNFAFFTAIGSFHTVIKFGDWFKNLKIYSYRKVLKSAALCSFAFVHNIPITRKNNCLKITTMVFNPLVFYIVTAIVFSMMTHYRELIGTAIPLVQVFERRDVDWARPIIAAFTISVVCLVLTEVLPVIYDSFVKLGSKEWRVFVPSIQYRSPLTGAPVLAIFAAGSLAAILAFACPLSHLIKLLNTATLVKCAIVSLQLLYNRYKPEINYDYLVHNTNIQYSKLGQNPVKPSISIQHISALKEKVKSWFTPKPQYIHRVSSPSHTTRKLVSSKNKRVERECLLMDDYNNKSINIDLAEDSVSENGDDLVICSEDEDSGSSTDIDLVVEEYKEGLKVATVGKFHENRRSTRLTSTVASLCLILVVGSSVAMALYVMRIINILWPSILGLVSATLIITVLPQNSSDKSRASFLPSIIFPLFNVISIGMNIILASTVLLDIWQGIVFWTLAGLLLFWRCDCCTCDGLIRDAKEQDRINIIQNSGIEYSPEYNHKENIVDTVYITR
ncbi:torn and diminished rhabdomeres isoform X2 [Leptinotarsa decemlineata]|uniref:torn and diminished rhabdomeres isoform X2 n=1 Tax=Leptinotarsa decemlineata TaxID=7539 RepID=UPI003D30B3D7